MVRLERKRYASRRKTSVMSSFFDQGVVDITRLFGRVIKRPRPCEYTTHIWQPGTTFDHNLCGLQAQQEQRWRIESYTNSNVGTLCTTSEVKVSRRSFKVLVDSTLFFFLIQTFSEFQEARVCKYRSRQTLSHGGNIATHSYLSERPTSIQWVYDLEGDDVPLKVFM